MKESLPFEAALFLLSVPQFRLVLSELLEEQLRPIKEAFKAAYKQDLAEYLTTKQALAFVGLSKPTFNKKRREGYITAYYSSDKRVLYKRSELVAYLESYKPKEGQTVC